MQTWQVIFLGLLEGATEFLPVSSTGHLLLAEHFLNIRSNGRTFEVLIQLGAILAIITVYFAKLLRILIDLPRDARTQRFVLAVLVAFLPAAVIGATLHKFIKDVLFNSPTTICVALVVGGIILLFVDRMKFEVKHHDVMDLPIRTAFIIGCCQCLAMIPGVSRSGSSIVGAMLLGADKRTAAEFSFFLAMPTMAGAFAYDLYKNYAILERQDIMSIALGFIVAFVSGVIVVRFFLDYVSRNGFGFFAWWRILVGSAGLAALAVIG
jgi:undecaprenyl-diphosphatase